MKLLVFGATGGTGRRLVQQSLDQGHVVTAFARDPDKIVAHENLRVVRGDVLQPDSVDAAVGGQDAVVSALGIRLPVKIVILIVIACQIVIRTVTLSWPVLLFVEVGVPILAILLLSARRNTKLSEGTRNIVRATERAGIKRFVYESSLGVGDSKWKLGVVHNLIAIPLFLRNILADKEVQEQIVASSSLDWVIVRPAALTNGPPRSVYRAGSDVGHWFFPSRISRSDVAAFMLEQLTGAEYLRKTPGLAY